jgi:hypothetical protein
MWPASRAGASGAVRSSWYAVPLTSLATAASASPAEGMSSATTCAPSRASTRAMAAPMPRAAPVTRAILPSSGRSQSAGGMDEPDPIRMTWPETYADRPDSRNRIVDSIEPSAPGAT